MCKYVMVKFHVTSDRKHIKITHLIRDVNKNYWDDLYCCPLIYGYECKLTFYLNCNEKEAKFNNVDERHIDILKNVSISRNTIKSIISDLKAYLTD